MTTSTPTQWQPLKMKRDSQCVRCDASLPKGTEGLYNQGKHIVACASHTELLNETPTSPTIQAGTAGIVQPIVAKAVPAAIPKVAEDWYDLALNKPGQGVRERAEYEKQELAKKVTRLGAFVLKVMDEKTDERSWRVGAIGEERVGSDLDTYANKWGAKVLHSVPVGNKGSDIDHVLIGPFGVYTVNTKRHPGAKVWCNGDTIKINYGQKVYYVRNSRHEAQRASKLLSAKVGWSVGTLGLIVVLTGTDITNLKVEKQPKDWVHVVGLSDMLSWLSKHPRVLEESQVNEIYEVARRNTTWLT